MKTLRVLMLTLAATLLATTIASAHSVTQRVDRREARQSYRLHQGVRSGQLTRAEARRLRSGQRQVRRMEFRSERDGVVTRRERFRMENAQDRQSWRIWRLKHNDRVR
jgi:glucose/arabinose dehydrogenase